MHASIFEKLQAAPSVKTYFTRMISVILAYEVSVL
jgi:hypothetical protein